MGNLRRRLVPLREVVACCEGGRGELARMLGQRVEIGLRQRTKSHAGCAWRETCARPCSPARSAPVLHACQIVRSCRPNACKHSTRLQLISQQRAFRHACASCCIHVLNLSPSHSLVSFPVTCPCTILVTRAISIHPHPLITTCWARETLGSESSVAFACRGRLQPRGWRVAQLSLSPPTLCPESSPCRRHGLSVCLIVTWPACA